MPNVRLPVRLPLSSMESCVCLCVCGLSMLLQTVKQSAECKILLSRENHESGLLIQVGLKQGAECKIRVHHELGVLFQHGLTVWCVLFQAGLKRKAQKVRSS